ncbi:MAG: molybdopterin molybdotransferase MoeA [Pseudomonadota bacterium]|nr:molybdopterin molybdotransferase MoeA [Pseudomonadota bacterium]
MLSLTEARALLLQGVLPVGRETMPIHAGSGRILAADVCAARDQPPAALSAMDGYAVRAHDAKAGALLPVVGEAPAGAPFVGHLGAGEAVRIATGGVVPSGADTIIIQENVVRDGPGIRIVEAPAAEAFIRAAGCDFAAGARIASAGETLTPARLALIAAVNLASVEVHARPRVAIFPSGDELREPGTPLRPGEIVNSAAYAIEALVESWGGIASRRPILPDDPDACEAALLDGGFTADVLVTLGGASVGDRDSLRPIFAKLGADIVFDRIAVQPGKPTWHARFPGGPLLLGLPGNPASGFVCAQLLLKPLLFALSGRDWETAVRLLPATLAADLPANGARETFVRASAAVDREGGLRVAPMQRQDSSLLMPLAAANALIRRLPAAPVAVSGDRVEFVPMCLADI